MRTCNSIITKQFDWNERTMQQRAETKTEDSKTCQTTRRETRLISFSFQSDERDERKLLLLLSIANERHVIASNVLSCCFMCESFGDHDSASVCPALALSLMAGSAVAVPTHTAACFRANIDCVVTRCLDAGCLCLLFNNQNESKRNERQNGMRKTKRKLVIIRYFAESVVNVCRWCRPRLTVASL